MEKNSVLTFDNFDDNYFNRDMLFFRGDGHSENGASGQCVRW